MAANGRPTYGFIKQRVAVALTKGGSGGVVALAISEVKFQIQDAKGGSSLTYPSKSGDRCSGIAAIAAD